MSELVLLGGGGHARVIAGVLARLEGTTIVGFTDSSESAQLGSIPYLGSDDVVPALLADHPAVRGVLAVGSVRDSALRRSVAERAGGLGLEFETVVSPAAIVSQDAILGAGCVVLDGAVVNVGARIGSFAIVNSNATVEHDCRIGDFVHIAPGATLSGGVSVGDDVLVGAGAVVIQSVTIRSGTIVGAGAVVIRDIDEPGVYVGNPAGRIR